MTVARGDRKVLAPVRFVGSYQDAFGRHDGVDQQQRRAPAAIRKQAAAGAEHEGGWIISRYSSIRSAAVSAAINCPLPMIPRLLLDACLSSATVAGTSPSRSVEFGHPSLVAGLCEATYCAVGDPRAPFKDRADAPAISARMRVPATVPLSPRTGETLEPISSDHRCPTPVTVCPQWQGGYRERSLPARKPVITPLSGGG
jgi:hypothetical protein